MDEILEKTHRQESPWHIIAANDKPFARNEAIRVVTNHLKNYGQWMESKAAVREAKSIHAALRTLKDT